MESKSEDAREFALREVEQMPGIQQRMLALKMQEQTGLARSTALRVLQQLERDGELEGRMDGRRKAYAIPGAPPTPQTGGPEPEVEAEQEEAPPDPEPHGEREWRDEEPEPAAEWQPEPEPTDSTRPAAPAVAAGGGAGRSAAKRAAAAAALLVAAVLVFVLAPGGEDDVGEETRLGERAEQQPAKKRKPAAQEGPAEKAAKPASPAERRRERARDRRRARATALSTAKRVNTAVLSGSPVPGIAGRTARGLRRRGFKVGAVTNAAEPSGRSVVLYGPTWRPAGRALARALRIRSVRRIDRLNRERAPRAGLVVVVGADRR